MLKVKEWIRAKKSPQFKVIQTTGNNIYVVERIIDGMKYVRDYTIKKYDQLPIMEAMRVKKFHEDLVHVDVTYYNRKSNNPDDFSFDEKNDTIEINEIPSEYLPTRNYKEMEQIKEYVKSKRVDKK